jgi:hydrogenase maturation protease
VLWWRLRQIFAERIPDAVLENIRPAGIRTLVLGLGNTLLSDEGAGVHAMKYLAEQYDDLPDTTFIDAGTLSFTLAADIAAADNLLIFDAAQLDAAPATIRVLEGSAFDEFLLSGRRSVHEVGFADLMDIARLQGCLPQRRALIGIQPETLGWGEEPGEAVAAVIPRAAALAANLIRRWAGAASVVPGGLVAAT